MNDINLYEQIPKDDLPVRLHYHYDCDYIYPAHWHEHTEFHFIFSGSAVLRCGDEYINLSSKDCAIINSNELHECVSGKCSYICMILPPSFLENEHVIFERIVHDEAISKIFADMVHILKDKKSRYDLHIHGLVYILLSYLLSSHVRETLTENEYITRAKKLDSINSAIKYINEHFTDDIMVDELARCSHMSRGHFSHTFKAVTGKTVKQYINELRLTKAAGLLKNTDMTVTETAICSGFSDSNYFSRLFKRTYDKTPCEYRNSFFMN